MRVRACVCVFVRTRVRVFVRTRVRVFVRTRVRVFVRTHVRACLYVCVGVTYIVSESRAQVCACVSVFTCTFPMIIVSTQYTIYRASGAINSYLNMLIPWEDNFGTNMQLVNIYS